MTTHINETEVKYLAGLLDADGHVGFEFTSNRVYLTISLTAADSIDRQGYVAGLPLSTGMGSVCRKEKRGDWSPISVWKISKAAHLEMIAPRLVKHMVIKGRHLQSMFDMWKTFRSRVLTDIEVEQLKVFTRASRDNAGPLKAKKHPTWAWVAGYLDGDGSYIFKQPPSQNHPRALVQATAHIKDRVALDLLFKAFGGTLNNRGASHPHIMDWKHSLGASNVSFAQHFLSKVLRHSKLKKHKIEQLLAHCHSHSHRLSVINSTE